MKVELNYQTKDRVFRHSSAGGKFQKIYAFIGDGLIDLYLRQKLFQIYFNDLKHASIERSILASKRSLSYISKELNLDKELIYVGNVNFSYDLLATIFEAYCCGIYFDYGIEKLFRFLENVLWSKREFLLSNFDDFISRLKREFPNSKIKIEKIGSKYKISLFIDNNLILEINHKNKEEGKYEIAKKFYSEIKNSI
ncbi:MAG: ribonuclease III domain-containing protein [Candidatus Hydrothermia bacterium]|nr:ribonuclease III domain-containing protein [Candidatus Hydrothermia bacterium]